LAVNEKEEASWLCFYASLHILLFVPGKPNEDLSAWWGNRFTYVLWLNKNTESYSGRVHTNIIKLGIIKTINW